MQIVLLYNDADGNTVNYITTYLKPLNHNIFYKALVGAGSNWNAVIKEKVEKADIIIPLVSASYLADDYEMQLLDFAAGLQKDIRPYLAGTCLYMYNRVLVNKKFITMGDIINLKPAVRQQMPVFTRPILTTTGNYSVTNREGDTIADDDVHLANILCALVDASNMPIRDLYKYAKTMLGAIK